MSSSSTVTAGAFRICACRSPIAATSAASTACRPTYRPWLDREEILSFEEIERLVRLLARMGGRDLRLTGGSRWCARLPAARLDAGPRTGIDDLSLTTNGYLLERDADALVAAGSRAGERVDRLARRDRFFQLTRRDSLPQVLAGLEAIGRHESVRPIKVNGVSCALHRGRGVAVRGVRALHELPGALHRVHAARRRPRLDERPGADRRGDPRDRGSRLPARGAPGGAARHGARVRLPGRPRRARLHQPGIRALCADCNRIRPTADGKLRTCLFSINETDLRAVLRSARTTPSSSG